MIRAFSTALLAAATLVVAGCGAMAADEPAKVSPAQADAFNQRLFAAPVGKATAHACFIRRYDANHLARHPLQKVASLKLLVIAGNPSGQESSNADDATAYSFRLGVKFRHRKGAFDSTGWCNHAFAEQIGDEVRLGCSVDCDGGGIEIGLSKGDGAAIVRLEHVRIWQSGKPDDEASDVLEASNDDRMFRLERTALKECDGLVTDKQDLAALRQNEH